VMLSVALASLDSASLCLGLMWLSLYA